MDYYTQYAKLIALMGMAFTFQMSHAFVMQMYNQLMEDIKEEKFELMDVLHHLTSREGAMKVTLPVAFSGV